MNLLLINRSLHSFALTHNSFQNAFYARQSMQHAPWGGSPCIVEELSTETWNRSNLEIPLSQQGHRAIPRKESVGTGVFLPRVANFSSQARRKQGMDINSKAFHELVHVTRCVLLIIVTEQASLVVRSVMVSSREFIVVA